MLELKDFYDDTLLARQVKHAEKEAAREEDEDEDEEEDEVAPRGTQRSRPEQIDSDEVDIDEEDEAEQHRQHIAKVKRERGQSRGLSLAPNHLRNESSEPGEDNLEAMDVD
jgi:E3 SUMO-protein ligase NSE2